MMHAFALTSIKIWLVLIRLQTDRQVYFLTCNTSVLCIIYKLLIAPNQLNKPDDNCEHLIIISKYRWQGVKKVITAIAYFGRAVQWSTDWLLVCKECLKSANTFTRACAVTHCGVIELACHLRWEVGISLHLAVDECHPFTGGLGLLCGTVLRYRWIVMFDKLWH